MTVQGDFRVEVKPYSGYDNPSLPIASWIASGTLTGDATGGAVQFTFLFQVAESDNVSERYDLEQLAIDVEIGTNVVVMMEAQGMEQLAFPSRNVEEQRWAMQVLTDGSGRAAVPLADLAGLPIWLGMPIFGVDAGVRLRFLNIDTIVYNATLHGYIWGPRSVLAPGGPQRPPNGYFR